MNDPGLMSIQIKDTLFKAQMYLHKIAGTNGSFAQIQKICHLAVQTCVKFSHNQQFAIQLYNRIQHLIKQTHNYFLLYLLDLLIKNSRPIMRIAKKEIEYLFKNVWENVWLDSKNQLKIQCMKAMARTWGIIYGDQILENLKLWIGEKYKTNLQLQKYQRELSQLVETSKVAQSYRELMSRSDSQKHAQKVLMSSIKTQKQRGL